MGTKKILQNNGKLNINFPASAHAKIIARHVLMK